MYIFINGLCCTEANKVRNGTLVPGSSAHHLDEYIANFLSVGPVVKSLLEVLEQGGVEVDDVLSFRRHAVELDDLGDVRFAREILQRPHVHLHVWADVSSSVGRVSVSGAECLLPPSSC